MRNRYTLIVVLFVVFITACGKQQPIPSQPRPFPTPLLYIQLTPASPQPNIAQTRPSATVTEEDVLDRIPQAKITQTQLPASTSTPLISSIYDTPTFSPTLTPIPTLKPNQVLPIVSIYMIDETSGWGIEENGHILHTRDGGTTWNDVTPPQGAYNKEGFFALDTQTAWATPYCLGGNFGGGLDYYCEEAQEINQTSVWTTHDGGTTWIASLPICINEGCNDNDPISSAGDGSLLPESIRFIDSQHGWLAISRGSSMYQDRYNGFYTDDGGENWNFLISAYLNEMISGYIAALEPLDEKNIFLFTYQAHGAWDYVGNNLWYSQSNDGGKNWNEDIHFALPTNPTDNPDWDNFDCGTIESEANPPLVLDLTQECHKQYDIITSYFIHLHSEDGGQTWNYWQQTGDVDFINAKTGWQLVAKDNTTHELQQTHDGGLSWAKIKTLEWDGILNFVNDQIGYTLAYNQGVMAVMHTSDGGKTWEMKSQASLRHVPCLISTWSVCD
jgi:photosystem II stability/assembly factor-like uncharacterized protein